MSCGTCLWGQVTTLSRPKAVHLSAHRVSALLEGSQKAVFPGWTSSHAAKCRVTFLSEELIKVHWSWWKSYCWTPLASGTQRENLGTSGLTSALFHTKQRAGFGLHMGCPWHCVCKVGAQMSKALRLGCLTPFHRWTGILGCQGPGQKMCVEGKDQIS